MGRGQRPLSANLTTEPALFEWYQSAPRPIRGILPSIRKKE